MNKHTPGPWTTCCLDRCPHHVYGLNGDEIICDLLHNEPNCAGYDKHSGIVTIDQRQANARLMAAAPELLQALENLLCEYEDRECQFGDDYLWVKHEDRITIDHARLTIAKAKGETK